MMLNLKPLQFDGLFEIEGSLHSDDRGTFTKLVHRGWFDQHKLESDFAEEYVSVSKRFVIRGMHFQTPPHDHVKLVSCIAGEALDVVVDLRKRSPTFGKATSVMLRPNQSLYIPKGMAHGFCAMTDNATLLYNVSTVYAPEHDSGIRWDSIAFEWPTAQPVLSQRDQNFICLNEFNSPF